MVTRSGNVDNITLGPWQCNAPGAATCQCSANVKVAGFVYLISILWLFLSAVKSADISELLTFVKIKIENDMFVAGKEVMSTQTWQCLHSTRWGCLVRVGSIKWCWPSICFSVNIYPIWCLSWAWLWCELCVAQVGHARAGVTLPRHTNLYHLYLQLFRKLIICTAQSSRLSPLLSDSLAPGSPVCYWRWSGDILRSLCDLMSWSPPFWFYIVY